MSAGLHQPKTDEDPMSNAASPFLSIANFAMAATPLMAVLFAYMSSFMH